MQLLIKAFSVEPPQTAKAVNEPDVEPQDSSAFDAFHSLISPTDQTEIHSVILNPDGERLARIEAELPGTSTLEAARTDELTAGTETIKPAHVANESGSKDVLLVTQPAVGTVRIDPKEMLHIEAASMRTDMDYAEENLVLGMLEIAGSRKADLPEVRARQALNAAVVAPPAERAVTAIDTSPLRDRHEAELDGAAKRVERQDADLGSPDRTKEIRIEQPDFEARQKADTGEQAKLSEVLQEAVETQSLKDKSMALPISSSSEQLSTVSNFLTAAPHRSRISADAPNTIETTAEKAGKKAAVSIPDTRAIAVAPNEKAAARPLASFKGDDLASKEAWTTGRAGFAAPHAQEQVAGVAIVIPGAGAMAKGGKENLGFGEVSIDKAEPIADGPVLEFEDMVKTKQVERVRLEPVAARSILNQVIQSVTRSHVEGFVEIRLQPEELGRIRLTMVAGEAGMTVQISAERPETLELVRRNIDLLENDLLDHGFEDLSFSFSGEDRSASTNDQGNPEEMEKTIEVIGSKGLRVALEGSLQPSINGTLDIRV